MAKATTYNVAGNREDLTDILSVIEPQETPITSAIKKGKAPGNVLIEWQVDDLANPSFDGVAEGTDVSDFDNKAANRARLGNYIQKFRRTWSVSDIQEAVDTAGVPSEKARSKTKCLLEIKRDIESAIASNNDRSSGPTHTLRGLGDWIDSTGPSDVAAAYRTPSGSIDTTTTTTLSEANINTVLQTMYENYGSKKDLTLFAGPALKKRISDFTRAEGTTTAKAYQVHELATSKTITYDVTLYDGPFAMVAIVPTLFNGRVSSTGGALTDVVRGRGYVANLSLLSLNYMKQPGAQELENEGGGPRGFVDAILTLCVHNPKGLGKFAPTALS